MVTQHYSVFRQQWCAIHIDGLVQERHNSFANALELVFLALTHYYTNPWKKYGAKVSPYFSISCYLYIFWGRFASMSFTSLWPDTGRDGLQAHCICINQHSNILQSILTMFHPMHFAYHGYLIDSVISVFLLPTQIARFMAPTQGPHGSCRP